MIPPVLGVEPGYWRPNGVGRIVPCRALYPIEEVRVVLCQIADVDVFIGDANVRYAHFWADIEIMLAGIVAEDDVRGIRGFARPHHAEGRVICAEGIQGSGQSICNPVPLLAMKAQMATEPVGLPRAASGIAISMPVVTVSAWAVLPPGTPAAFV